MTELELLNMGTAALKKAALNEQAKAFILNNATIYASLKKAAERYIGGESLIETIDKVKQENARGLKCSIEFMGENTRTELEANDATQEFIAIARSIKTNQLHSTLSLDLSHIGLAISKDLCKQNLAAICDNAALNHTEVTISAEGADRTDDVIELYQWGAKHYPLLSITLQAYLHRTEDDFNALIKLPGRIRMVKGAFDVPAELALARGASLDKRYLGYVEQLLSAKHKCAIATHHDYIQQEAKKLIEQHKPDPQLYEFESLYGIQTEQLLALKQEGYPVKLYFVYGKEWYLYVCNRIAEYPLNIFRALHDLTNAQNP